MLLTSLGCWWWASGDVAKRFESRKVEIDADFSGASVQSGAPNQGVIDKIKQQEDDLKLKVYHAWETLYAEQKKTSSFPTKVLGEAFKKEFEKLQPPKDQLDPKYLEIYQNHIQDYLPTLEQIVKVRHEVTKDDGTVPGGGPARVRPKQPGMGQGFGPGGGPGRRMTMPGGIMPGGTPITPGGLGADSDKEYTGIVDWDEGDIAQLQTQHFDWGGRAPTTLEVMMAQEDLAVYESLLRIIKKVNEGATAQPNAAIKRIVALDIGKDSGKAWDEARKAVFGPAALGDHRGLGQPQSLPTSPQGEQALFEGRYVNEKGGPFPTIPNSLAIPSSK